MRVRCFEALHVFQKWRRAVSNRLTRLIHFLNQLRLVFPALKRLLFEAFWFLFAAVEILRFLRSLLTTR